MTTSDLAPDDLRVLAPDWERHLKAARKAESTVETYLKSVRILIKFLLRMGLPTTAAAITHKQLESVFIAMGDAPNERTGKAVTPANVAKHFRHVQQFFKWLRETEEEIAVNPFDKLRPPHVVPPPIAVIPDEYMTKLLAACKGNSFEPRRDAAMIRCFLDTGVRAGGLATVEEDGLNFDYNTMTIVLKGGRTLAVPFGFKTAEALRRYQRVRSRHPFAREGRLWIGKKGPLGQSALAQILNRRCADAKLPHIFPHQFRHTFCHQWLLNGGNESDLMRLMGWQSRDMITRYARSASEQRARLAHQKAALGDRV